MWLNTGHIYDKLPSGLDSIHNYYERLVLEEIARQSPRAVEDQDFCADVACVALNRLPPRYIRFDVDMTFFLSPVELQEIHDKVTRSVDDALNYVTSRGKREEVGDDENFTEDADAGDSEH